MANNIWIKCHEQRRQRWIETNPQAWRWSDRGHYEDIEPVQRLTIGAQVSMQRGEYNRETWSYKYTRVRRTDAEMIADGYRQVPREFSGDIIVRADVSTYGDDPTVQLPAEYGNACVRMLGTDLATMICEGHVIDNVIRGPFKLYANGPKHRRRITLHLCS